jgi:hypothetical protein
LSIDAIVTVSRALAPLLQKFGDESLLRGSTQSCTIIFQAQADPRNR